MFIDIYTYKGGIQKKVVLPAIIRLNCIPDTMLSEQRPKITYSLKRFVNKKYSTISWFDRGKVMMKLRVIVYCTICVL